MRTISFFSGIFVLALSGAGCTGLVHELHPEYAHGGARDIHYSDGNVALDGRHAGPPEGVIRASGDAYATRTDADTRRTVAVSRSGISAAHAEMILALTPEIARCMHGEDDAHERDFSTCIGRNPQLLQVLISEDPSFGSYLGGGAGGPGYYFPGAGYGYDPTALADTYGGYGSVGAVDMSRRVERLEGAVGGAVNMFHGYTTAETTEGGAR